MRNLLNDLTDCDAALAFDDDDDEFDRAVAHLLRCGHFHRFIIIGDRQIIGCSFNARECLTPEFG